MNSSTSPGASATAMRSCDSLMASSVPSRPSYFLGTASRSIRRPSASSPMATETPPAPKSLQRLIRRQASSRRKRRWSLRSMGALPFWTSAPSFASDSTLCALDEPVAPPMPSRPVRPPRRTILSPGAGVSRRTWWRWGSLRPPWGTAARSSSCGRASRSCRRWVSRTSPGPSATACFVVPGGGAMAEARPSRPRIGLARG